VHVPYNLILHNPLDVLQSIDASHLSFALEANEMSNASNPRDLATTFSIDFQYPEEELYISVNLNSSIGGIGAKGGAGILFGVFKFQHLNLYDIITDPSSLTSPLSIASGLYGLEAFIDRLNLGINLTLAQSGKERQVMFESNDNEGFGRILTGYLVPSAKLVQNVINGVKQLYIGARSNATQAWGQDYEYGSSVAQSRYSTELYIAILVAFIGFNACFLFWRGTHNYDYVSQSEASEPSR